ncbi:right-handed parallel beta-helix repeat-containing protein [Cryobacterium aureum]|uniref:right-handed parallel beta-helix repeat-containing protein n=1 Tax=Cryobacterium aureum TaxID=995037 RepID=UPI000CF48CB9|nr:right-handed parallel beta-helix repeat-containing protein [Cryobacterium aureum]
MRRRAVAAVAAALVLGALALPVTSGIAFAADDETDASRALHYAGDPAAEARISAAEERRLIEVRSIANAADWSGQSRYKPYRMVTGNLYTLVLVAREAPYTLDHLARLAPRTFTRQPDGSYLLAENIVVEDGATLDLSDEGLVLRMLSTAQSFVSIVTLGGSLSATGSTDQPMTVTSWDPDTGKVDSDTSDGRAYIRVIGGHAELGFAAFDHLGFWSGMTGGLSLTGTDLPDKGTDNLPEKGTNARDTEGIADTATMEVFGTEILTTEEASVLDMSPDLSGYSYVSALIHDVTLSNNAFGLFVTSADGVVVRDSVVEDSLVDGIVFHRHVTNSEIERTSSTGNIVDGFRLTRATSGIILDHVTANDNGRNGISLDGQPLAEGPSATGMPVGVYGNNTVSNSSATSNGRYGIEVIGGENILVDGNTVTRNSVGIVVRSGAAAVMVKGNTVEGSGVQGIAIRDAALDNVIRSNTVTGGETGIYLRDAGAFITRNTVEDVTNHAVTLIGATGSSDITRNTVSGSGPSAIDVARTVGATTGGNDVENWRSTKPLDVILRGIFQPLTVMWLLLAALLLVTAVSSIGRRHTSIRHPYANLAPLSSYTKGEISRDQVLAPAAVRRRANTE